MTDDRGPQLKHGSGYQRLGQLDDAQIIVQVGATAAVVRTASHADARSALAPLAGPSDVLTAGTQEEDVCAAVPALSPPFESSAGGGKALEVKVIGDSEEQVNVFRVWLVRRNRTDERESEHAGKSARGSYEAESFQKKELTQGRQSVLGAAHEEPVDYDA